MRRRVIKRQRQTQFIGTVISKPFGSTFYRGVVSAFDAAAGFYKIVYDDGDEEELDEAEVAKFKTRDDGGAESGDDSGDDSDYIAPAATGGGGGSAAKAKKRKTAKKKEGAGQPPCAEQPQERGQRGRRVAAAHGDKQRNAGAGAGADVPAFVGAVVAQ